MNLIMFDSLSLSLLLAIFACAAGLVWFAGTRLSRYANALAKNGNGRRRRWKTIVGWCHFAS